MKPIEGAIVRIFAQNKTSIVGVGFLIDGKRVMTCAHVVATAFGIPRDVSVQDLPAERITLDFPLVDDNHPCTASVILWLPPQPDETGDIAVLELDQQRPFSTSPAKLVELSESWDKPFGVYGYPQSEGGWASGVVRGRIAGKRLQIINKDEKSYFIQPGFSGSPVYCGEADVLGVIGMVSSGETDPDLDVGFMIPADVLLKVKDQQNVHPLPSPELAESHTASASGISVPSEQSSASPLFSRKFAPRVVYIGKFAEMPRQLKPKNVFVAHPFFGGDAQKLTDYRYYLKDGLESIGYEPLFARDDPGYLLETICRDIIDTEAGIYDVTGYNANVLIELGMSIGLNQPTVVIAQDDNAPLIPALQQLNPIRYESRYDLTDLVGPAVRERIQAYWQSGMSPRFCASCGLDCIARKPRQSPEAEYLVIGADPQKDKAIFHHLKKAVKNFNLNWQQIEGDFNLVVCQWTEEIKRCKLVFFHSKEGTTRHSGTENAATMVRVGIAVGMGIAWRMILKQGDHMPTDLEGFKYTTWDESPTSFEAALSSAVRQLLGEVRPFGGTYDALPPTEAVEDEDENALIIESRDALQRTANLVNVPEWRTNYTAPEIAFEAVRKLLLEDEKNVVIIGPPGVGKTILAAALCHDEVVQNRFQDAIYWINAARLTESEYLLEEYVQLLFNLTGEAIPQPTIQFLMAKLSQIWESRSLLLVLNGLDETTASVREEIVNQLQAMVAATSSRLLITSRPHVNQLFPESQFTIYSLGETTNRLPLFAGQKVFISYKRGNEFAAELIRMLREAGLEVLPSENNLIPGGANWSRQIQDEINDAAVFIVVATSTSVESSFLRGELAEAQKLNKPIIPILFDEGEISPDLEAIQYVDFRKSRETGFEQLVGALRRYLTENTSEDSAANKYLFVNYSRVDQPLTDQITDAIRAAGFAVWADNQLFGGQDWWSEITRRIEGCTGMIYLLSDTSVKSEYCRQEFELARNLGIPSLLVQIRDRTQLSDALSSYQYLDLSDGLTKGNVTRLLNSIEVILKSPNNRVGKALENTVATLNEVDRQRFAQIGAMAPSPATFDQNALISIWQTDQASALSTIDTFLKLALIQEVSPNRYQAHELVIDFARRLFEAEDESEGGQSKKEASQIRVFINYARADTLDLARKMSSALKAQGYDVFFDMDIWDKDANIEIDIQSEVSKSDLLVSLQSPNTFASEWWMKELAWALEMGKLVVPVLVDGYVMPRPDNLPKQISQLAYLGAVTFRSQQFEQDFRHLAAQLQKVKSRPISDDRRYVYISGTQRDLPDHRNAIENAIQLLAMHSTTFEDFGATAQDALTTVFDMIAESDIYILLLGHRYGYVPDNRRNPEGLSITELEYNEATRLNKPILAFVMDDQHQVSSQSMENDQISSRKLQAFKRKVMQRHVVELFTSSDDLKAKALQALSDPQLMDTQRWTKPNQSVVPQAFRDAPVAPDVEFIQIPNGIFLMGQTDGPDDSRPQHRVDIESFLISKYPITKTQFYYFIIAGGYEKPEYWTTNGWKLANRHDWSTRLISNQTDRASLDGIRDQFRKGVFPPPTETSNSNQPIVQVSWYEANAFCRWFSEITGRKYDLPSEAQWEKSARGTDGRIYPWGNEFDSSRCNTSESRIGLTTPVNTYPNGSSIYGVIDLSGNIWEWTRSQFRGYPYRSSNEIDDDTAERTRIVIRGGSFRDDRFSATTFHRGNSQADNQADNLGFRLVLLP